MYITTTMAIEPQKQERCKAHNVSPGTLRKAALVEANEAWRSPSQGKRVFVDHGGCGVGLLSEGDETVGTGRALHAHLGGTSTFHSSSWAFNMREPNIYRTLLSPVLSNSTIIECNNMFEQEIQGKWSTAMCMCMYLCSQSHEARRVCSWVSRHWNRSSDVLVVKRQQWKFQRPPPQVDPWYIENQLVFNFHDIIMESQSTQEILLDSQLCIIFLINYGNIQMELIVSWWLGNQATGAAESTKMSHEYSLILWSSINGRQPGTPPLVPIIWCPVKVRVFLAQYQLQSPIWCYFTFSSADCGVGYLMRLQQQEYCNSSVFMHRFGADSSSVCMMDGLGGCVASCSCRQPGPPVQSLPVNLDQFHVSLHNELVEMSIPCAWLIHGFNPRATSFLIHS